ncbi:MAG: hypothetical protein GX814_03865 [Microbacteriaceae bacterium]|nr:hypothetical protein [Microbacteriaceae bacterium]
MSEDTKYSVMERVLAYVAISIMVIAVLSFLTVLVVALVAGREVLASGLWELVSFIAYFGLPTGFVLLMILLGINFRKRNREQ